MFCFCFVFAFRYLVRVSNILKLCSEVNVGIGRSRGAAELPLYYHHKVLSSQRTPGTQCNLEKGFEAALSRAIVESHLLWVPYSKLKSSILLPLVCKQLEDALIEGQIFHATEERRLQKPERRCLVGEQMEVRWRRLEWGNAGQMSSLGIFNFRLIQGLYCKH